MDQIAARSLLGVQNNASHSEIETAWRAAQDATLAHRGVVRRSMFDMKQNVAGFVFLVVGCTFGNAVLASNLQPTIQVADATRQLEPAKVEVKVADQPPVVAKPKHKPSQSEKGSATSVEVAQTPPKAAKPGNKKTLSPDPFLPNWSDASSEITESFVRITCNKDAQVFVDGVFKGRIASGSLTIAIKPGKHKLTMTHAEFGFYTQEIDIASAKTEHVQPKECN
jgi:hypothetical protein